MLCSTMLALAAEPPPRSVLPVSSQLQWQHYGNELPPANSGYGSGTARHRRRMDVLTEENTDPIRLTVDYGSLYEETAPQYSACFQVGAWFAQGLPGPDPPANGVPTCQRDGTDSDCWGLCTAEDLISAGDRDKVIAVVDRVVEEVEGLFALQQSTEPLVFSNSVGRYASALSAKGYPIESACARDCTLVNGVAVADLYCEQGVTADAVVSITKTPTIPGVAGTGGACASDTTGRPTWLVFTWIQTIVGMADQTVEQLLDQHRALIIHELIHCLGFSNVNFRSARNGAGELKNLLALKQVTDVGGANADEVWFFEKGRAYELAQQYFNCLDNSSWDGLPLMGFPDLGRASHWETRIMRDDVMSYGGYPAVSAITLAAMEDLGFYLANYSAAQCMSWGYYQGCQYVVDRCGTAINDQSMTVDSSSECAGESTWPQKYDSYLAQSCAHGLDPCSSNENSGYESVGGVFKCNGQCYVGPNRQGCTAAPTSSLETAGEGGLSDLVSSMNWEQFLWIAAWILGGVVAALFLREFLCPKPGSRRVLGIASTILTLAGLSCAIFNILILARVETLPTLDALGAQVEAFIGSYIMVGFGIIGFTLMFFGLLSLFGICFASKRLMLLVFSFWSLVLLLEIIASILVCYWIYILDDVPNQTLETLQGTSNGRYDGLFAAEALVEVEGIICQMYKKCCRDPTLDLAVPELGSGSGEVAANRTCVYAHEGTTSDVAISMEDPSSENFCPYVTGSSIRIAPPEGICNPLDSVYSLDTCRANFCLTGAEGYFDFLMNIVAFVREYAKWIGGGFSILVLIEMILIINLHNLRKRFAAQDKHAEALKASGVSGDGITIGVDKRGSTRGSTRNSNAANIGGIRVSRASRASSGGDRDRQMHGLKAV